VAEAGILRLSSSQEGSQDVVAASAVSGKLAEENHRRLDSPYTSGATMKGRACSQTPRSLCCIFTASTQRVALLYSVKDKGGIHGRT